MNLTTKILLVSSFSIAFTACNSKATKEQKDTTPHVETVRTNGLKIAFYDQDSLVKGFEFYKEMDEKIKAKEKRFQEQLASKETEIRSFAENMNQKLNAGQLSQDQAEKMQLEGQRKQDSYYNYQQTEGAKLEKETLDALKVISNKVKAAGKKYAEKHGIDLILTDAENGSQFNYINPKMDITAEFIEFLNQEEEELNASLSGKK